MTNKIHRIFNSVAIILTCFGVLFITFGLENRIQSNEDTIEQCEVRLYEKLTGEKDPLRSSAK
tara:strand:+ start:7260 stop:7448 length:189 start_codon:yes stop_codon:yes gene_type:complete